VTLDRGDPGDANTVYLGTAAGRRVGASSTRHNLDGDFLTAGLAGLSELALVL